MYKQDKNLFGHNDSLSSQKQTIYVRDDIFYKQGSIFWYNFGDVQTPGVIAGNRPCLIVSNNVFNHHSPSVTVVALTTRCRHSPVHVKIIDSDGKDRGYALCEQIRTVNKELLTNSLGVVTSRTLNEVLLCLQHQMSLLSICETLNA